VKCDDLGRNLRRKPSSDISTPLSLVGRALTDVILPAAARRVFATGGGGVTGKSAAAAFGGVIGQLMLMLCINHTNEQEQKSEKSS